MIEWLLFVGMGLFLVWIGLKGDGPSVGGGGCFIIGSLILIACATVALERSGG